MGYRGPPGGLLGASLHPAPTHCPPFTKYSRTCSLGVLPVPTHGTDVQDGDPCPNTGGFSEACAFTKRNKRVRPARKIRPHSRKSPDGYSDADINNDLVVLKEEDGDD